MKTMKLFALLLLTSTANAATWYVSPTGNDGNTGTLAEPFRTIQKGHDVAVAGDTIYVRGGTYAPAAQIILTRDGVDGNPIKLINYPDEFPVIDGVNMTGSDSDNRSGKPLRLTTADWWVVEGFDIKNGPCGGVIINRSNNNILRRITSHHNGNGCEHSGHGFFVLDTSSNNLIENCDSYANRNGQGTDPGGDADGYAFAFVGPGNVIRNSRAWNNSDDGYDLYRNFHRVVIEGNYAFRNGFNEAGADAGGNGDGFKVGGPVAGSGGHLATNNLSWANKQHGYDNNGAPAVNTLYNNAAWRNNNKDFIFSTNQSHILRNNLAFGPGGVAINAGVDDAFNSWNLPITINAADFESLVDTIARGPRRSDGTLPASGFLHLATDSDLIDQGTDVGLPYSGMAPDLGAYEALPPPSGLPTVTVAATDPTATEAGVTTGTVVVSRTGSTAAALTVNYTVSGAATPGSDYTALTGSVTIPAAAASATITVTPINDTAVEPNEIVMVSLRPDGTYVVGAPGSSTVTIVSDDVAPPPSGLPTVTVAATDPTATEAGVTTGTVVVSRTGSTAAALTVNYTVSGAATPGSDYTALTGSVTIPAAATSATIIVTPINDTAVEPNEMVVVSLSPDGAYVVGAPGSSTVTIVSDDVAPSDKDLVTEGLALSAGSVAAGSSVTASYRVANRGTTKVTETYTDKLYLSTNATLEAGDVLLGTSHGHTADLALNATHAHSQAVTVPAGTAAGSYFLVVQTDSLAAVTETNEGNNITAVALAVTPPPPTAKDLVTEGLTLSAGSVAAGGSVTASYRVANRGTTKVTETYTDKLYRSTNATLDAGDVLLGTSHGHTADLALNATHAHSQAVTVPAGTAAGSYFLVVQADSLAAVTETNEGNNITAVALTVNAP